MCLTILMKCVTTAAFRSEMESTKEDEIFSWETEYTKRKKKNVVLYELFLIYFIIEIYH